MTNNISDYLSTIGTDVHEKIKNDIPKNISLNFDNAKMKSRTFYKVRYSAIAAAAIVFCFLCGFTVKQIFFSNIYYFSSLEDENYVSVYNLTEENNDISVTLQAILCDGINTYARIKIDGDIDNISNAEKTSDSSLVRWLLEMSDDTHSDSYNEGRLKLYDKISSAYLSEGSSKTIVLSKENGQGSSEYTTSSSSETRTFSSDSLEFDQSFAENEIILIFDGCLSKTGTADLNLILGNDNEFEFKDINVIVPEIKVKDFANENYTINFDGAEGKVLSVKYGLFSTEIEVNWKYDIEQFFNDSKSTTYDKIVAGDYSQDVFLEPNDSDDYTVTTKYILRHKLNPNDKIQFIRYNYVDGKADDTSINKLLCYIE